MPTMTTKPTMMRIRSRLLPSSAALLLALSIVPPSVAAVQTPGQAACVASVAKSAASAVKARLKNVASCIKSVASATDNGCPDANTCLVGDVGGKAAKSVAKLEAADAACTETPGFGYRPVALVATSIKVEVLGLVDDVLGADASAALVSKVTDVTGSACQAKLIGAASKLMLTIGAEYDACKTSGTDDGSITDSGQLASVCLDAIDADAKGKIAGARKGIDGIVGSLCAGSNLAALFPGSCASKPAFGDCLETTARCHSCRRGAVGDDTGADCDLFDDAIANGSCSGASNRCNGRPELCGRTFDHVAYPTTHNAMSNSEEGWGNPNQHDGITRQLANGVRSMMLDTYFYGGAVVLCHAICDLGEAASVRRHELLVDGLARIREYLEVDPEAVLSIIFESYITEEQVAQAFSDAGLEGYLHEQPVADPWPTLGQLIATGKRLVVFTDDSSASLPWHHYVWDYAWETPYSFASTSAFTCAKNRGTAGAALYIFNHFLTQTWGNAGLAAQANRSPVLPDRAAQCHTEAGQLPNFVTVDFYDIGAVMPTVDTLNGFAQCGAP